MFVINGRFLTQKATGVHRYAFEICNKLQELGVDFYVAIPKKINTDYKFKFKTVQCGNLDTHLWEQINLPHYLKKQGSPLLISFSGCGPLNYRNQIITIHDVSYERHPEWFSQNFFRYYHFMMPRIARKSHAVLTVSEFSKKEIIETTHVLAEKIHVVHGNVPFHDIPSEKEVLDSKPNNEAEKYILTVSSMDPRKNFVRLVEAFSKLEDKSIKLYIVGMQFKAFNTPDLQKLINENVILSGYIDDEALKKKYMNALFSVYPSLYEGFGLPPLESMAYGCPTLLSDIPALREISGDAALYADPYSATDMTAKMDLLAKDEQLRNELKRKGLNQIKNYSWEKSAKQVLELAKQFI